MPITAHFPNAVHSVVVPQPTSAANGSVWVSVRCPFSRSGSSLSLVAWYTPSDSFSITSATNSDATPKVRATVAPPLFRVTFPDRSRSGKSAPPAHTAVPTAIASGDCS
jgi:hypothetical protein